MPDPRVQDYAKLLVDTCVGVQDGWQVVVTSTPLARPLVEEVARLIGERGAYAIMRLSLTGALGASDLAWVLAAPETRLAELSDIDRHTLLTMDAAISIAAPENTRDGSAVGPERIALLQQASRPVLERIVSGEVPWAGCQYPCPAYAQEAEMSVGEFEELLYGAVLLDWDEERRKMERIAERFDAADEVRIVGAKTDLRLSLAGRTGQVDAGGANMPGGEVFYSPVEDSAEGTIAFVEFPAVYAGRSVEGIRFRFEGGRIVDASAERNEDFLLETLDTDEGARRLGELRNRLQSRDHPPHEEHALRREDLRHRPSRHRQRLSVPRRQERKRRPLGHRQGPPQRRRAPLRRGARPARGRVALLGRAGETGWGRVQSGRGS